MPILILVWGMSATVTTTILFYLTDVNLIIAYLVGGFSTALAGLVLFVIYRLLPEDSWVRSFLRF